MYPLADYTEVQGGCVSVNEETQKIEPTGIWRNMAIYFTKISEYRRLFVVHTSHFQLVWGSTSTLIMDVTFCIFSNSWQANNLI
jgi:hypothetical protein